MTSLDAKTFGRAWKARLDADPLAVRALAALWSSRGSYATPVIDRTRRENLVLDAVIEADLVNTRRHVLEHFRALLALPTERAAELGEEPLAFVMAHGVRRAQAGIPLRAVLQAYRTGHKSFWAAMCDMINRFAEDAEAGLRATMLLSDYCIEYTDLISIAVTDAYVAEESRLAAERTRVSVAVLEDLLRGQPARTADAVELCERRGIGDGRAMVVVSARGADRSSASSFSAQERGNLSRLIEHSLSAAEFGSIVDLRMNEVVAIVSCPANSGERVAYTLREQLGEAIEGTQIRIGIGLDVDRIAELPRSYAEALAAIAILGQHRPLAHLGNVSIDDYLRYNADKTAKRLVPSSVGALAGTMLADTLWAFAAASLNVKACANILKVHNNTVYHRLNNVRRVTGVDPRTYAGLSHLLAGLSIASWDSMRQAEATDA